MKTISRASLGLALALLAGSLLAQVRAEDVRPRPKVYGTNRDSIYHVPITEFVPLDGSWVTRDYSFPGSLARYVTNCTGPCMYAIPHLPNGALLTGIQVYFCNTDPDHGHVLSVYLNTSSFDGTGNTSLSAPVSSSSSNGCGEFESADLTSLNYTVNDTQNQLSLGAFINNYDGSQAIAGVNLFYRLQVSRAPLIADFSDVPTDHPYFQFIEALSSSGITAGCGNGEYCPDRPITRGEMAVFVAKALGLQWP